MALSLQPGLVDALVERGALYRLNGKDDLARKDWLKVLELASGSPAGDAARRGLEDLDVNKDK